MGMANTARVFPRKTEATPTDELAFVNCPPPLLTLPEIDEVHISVAFTYDIPRAEELAYQWEVVGVPIRVGGPAYNEPGGEFIPGRYLKYGYTVTSRGRPNRCWFCKVPEREGGVLRELPIKDGWNILDDNLLACSEDHIRMVFSMLAKQPQRPIFSGGLEAKLLRPWHVEELYNVRTKRMYFAYDTPDDLEPLFTAGKLLRAGGFTPQSHKAACYVLIGYPGDNTNLAEIRLLSAWDAGFWPYAMLYRDTDSPSAKMYITSRRGKLQPVSQEWQKFYRNWSRPEIVGAQLQQIEPLWMEDY